MKSKSSRPPSEWRKRNMFGSKHVRKKTYIYIYTRILVVFEFKKHLQVAFSSNSQIPQKFGVLGWFWAWRSSCKARWLMFAESCHFCKTSWLADMQGHTHFPLVVVTSGACQVGDVFGWQMRVRGQDRKNARSAFGRPLGATRRVRLGDSSSKRKINAWSTPALRCVGALPRLWLGSAFCSSLCCK